MSRRSGIGILGVLLVTGVAAGILKYLKDYGGAQYLNKDKVDSVKADSEKVKAAAKRTYTAIKGKNESGDLKEAVGDLAKAASETAVGAGDVAFAAGSSAVDAAKDIKARFDADPDASRKEMITNLKEMGQDFADKAADYGKTIKDKTIETVDKVKGMMTPETQEDDNTDETQERSYETKESPACESYSDVMESAKEGSEDVSNSEPSSDESPKIDDASESATGSDSSEKNSEESKSGPSYIEITDVE